MKLDVVGMLGHSTHAQGRARGSKESMAGSEAEQAAEACPPAGRGQAWEVPGSWTAPLCKEVLEAREDALSGVVSGDPGSHSLKAT